MKQFLLLLMLALLIILCPGTFSPLAADAQSGPLQERFVKALKDDDAAEVSNLLAEGFDPVAPLTGAGGHSAFSLAAMSDKRNIVRALLDGGVDPNAIESGPTNPLYAAAGGGHEAVVRLLLDAGANPDGNGAKPGEPLYVAMMANKFHIVAQLVEAGATVTDDVKAMGELLARKGDPSLREALGKHAAYADDPGVGHGQSSAKSLGGADGSGKDPAGSEPGSTAGNPVMVEGPGRYPSGYFGGACFADGSDSPAKNTRPGDTGFAKSTVTSFLVGHVEAPDDSSPVADMATLSSALPGGAALAVRPPDCEPVELAPGDYTVVTHSAYSTWTWVCTEEGVPAGECRFVKPRTHAGYPKTSRTYTRIEVRPAPEGGDGSDKEKPSVAIVAPDDNGEYSFNGADPGRFELFATATTTPPEYADQVVWELEAVGKAKITYDPPRGAETRIVVEGLPALNDDFGEKKLTARIPGASDDITIKVYFFSEARNHPGEGAGETANWFYYWRQTSAAQGHADILEYHVELAPMNRPGDSVLGRHDRGDDLLHLSDLVATSDGCTRRKEGGHGKDNARGIDCFAEVIRHEHTHRQEWHRWWLSGTNQVTRFMHMFSEDGDGDYLPTWVEENEPGCRDDNRFSCTGRPTFTAPPREVPDTELYAYFKGWKWPLNGARTEDWSYCGQQWTLTKCK